MHHFPLADFMERKARIYGFSHFSCVDKGEFIDVKEMVLPEDERGKGIGSQFMQKICDEADRQGEVIGLCPDPLMPNSTKDDKIRLTEWYKRFGFTENPDESKFYGVSYVRMPAAHRQEDK